MKFDVMVHWHTWLIGFDATFFKSGILDIYFGPLTLGVVWE